MAKDNTNLILLVAALLLGVLLFTQCSQPGTQSIILGGGSGGGVDGQVWTAPSPTPSTCTDSDFTGGTGFQPTILGVCSSTTNSLSDTCASLTSVSEKTCNSMSECQSQTVSCTKGWSCISGICRVPRCEDVVNPLDQSWCDPASSPETGNCIFYPAHGDLPNRCDDTYIGPMMPG